MKKEPSAANSYLSPSFRRLSEWWIDDAGIWHFRAYPDAYYSQLLLPGFPDNVKNDGVYFRHFGLVKVTISGNSVFIAWDVHAAAYDALQSLFEFLGAKGQFFKTFELAFCFGGWHRESHDSAEAALRRIWQISSYRATEMANSIIQRRREDLDPKGQDATLIRSGLQAWQDGVFNDPAHAQRFLHAFSPHVLMFKQDQSNGQLELSYVGLRSAYTQALGKNWANEAISRPFHSDTPDQDYSYRIGQAYGEVLENKTPRLDHIRALIRPSEGDPVWWPYQRLLIPLADKAGNPLLLCLARIKPDIDIPFMAGA